MSLARSILTFCIDVSPSMGRKRIVEEEVAPEKGMNTSWLGLSEEEIQEKVASLETEGDEEEGALSGTKIRRRETTDLEWVNEFVAKKIQSYVLSGLKTAKIHIILFGSPRTNNTLLKTTDVGQGYEGIDEVMTPAPADVSTLDLIRCLRAAKEEEDPHKADPLDAIVAAITSLNNKDVGGISENSKDTWRRTIYLVTNGETQMNRSDWKQIQDKFLEDKITLKVVGVDFDDPEIEFEEEHKSSIKADNEEWWRDFLAKLPGAGIASAANVNAQSKLPSIQLQSSAPTNLTLTFGDPDERYDGSYVIDIPIRMYKATALARALTQKKLSKVAQESAAAKKQMARIKEAQSQLQPTSTPSLSQTHTIMDDSRTGDGTTNGAHDDAQTDGAGLTYGVQMMRKYYIKEEMERLEGGMDNATPLPEGAEESFDRAYKLGASLVAINEDLTKSLDTKLGIEIIQFTNARTYRRQYHMGETSFVFASEGNVKAQLQLSSLIKAMNEQEKYAIVRCVRRNDAEPKVGILAPAHSGAEIEQDYECFFFVEAPFREDLKRFTFPPLDRVVSRDGKELKEHPVLPSEKMQQCMDDLVDKMDLMDAEEDEQGHPVPWFTCEESFNPAIHLIKEAVSWRVFHQDDKTIPKPHQEVEKFLQRPQKLVQRSQEVAKRCREVFELEYVPTSAMRKAARKQEAGERERKADKQVKEVNLEGVMDEELEAERQSQAANSSKGKKESQENGAGTKERLHAFDASDTEEEEEDDLLQRDNSSKNVRVSKRNASKPQHAGWDESSNESSLQLKRGDIVADFETRLAEKGADLDPVMEAMEKLIRQTIMESFSSNEYGKARDFLKSLRAAAIDYEEGPRFNKFLRNLKTDLVSSPVGDSHQRSRADFWDNFVRGMEELSLITDDEDPAASTGVTKSQAEEFIND